MKEQVLPDRRISRHIRSIPFFVVWTSLLLFLNGCATIPVSDNISIPASKGCVEFFNDKDNRGNLGMVWYVNKYEEGIEIETESYSSWSGTHRPRRFFENPGNYIFVLHFGSYSEKVKVEIFEGMVTPVRVTILSEYAAHSFWTRETTFKWEVRLDVEAPISCRKSQ